MILQTVKCVPPHISFLRFEGCANELDGKRQITTFFDNITSYLKLILIMFYRNSSIFRKEILCFRV
ncbi:hypothetical protein HanXRQr2_Chr02g0083871 [Helianthus annuus]|nr:hypothetical protein HanXRQr2_Chr02g0083871 [Helianthus annuus]KAJ0953208.1 hypothetical protein HanPSC8_Chr02g0081261 [Helianthus annuus]